MENSSVVIGILGLVVTMGSIAFGMWAFVVKTSAERVSEQISSLLNGLDKLEARFRYFESQLQKHQDTTDQFLRDIRHDINHHSNRITKLEAHTEKLFSDFSQYKNGTGL